MSRLLAGKREPPSLTLRVPCGCRASSRGAVQHVKTAAMASTPVWTIGSLLTWTMDFFAKKAVDEPRLSAELLLAHALQCSRMAPVHAI